MRSSSSKKKSKLTLAKFKIESEPAKDSASNTVATGSGSGNAATDIITTLSHGKKNKQKVHYYTVTSLADGLDLNSYRKSSFQRFTI
jgi:hypothetical protein